MSEINGKKTLHRIRSTVFGRTMSLAKLSINAGAQLAGHGLGNLFKNQPDKENHWKQFLTSQAQVFTQEVGELKGSLMKAGQMLSMYGEHFFPPEVNQFLKSLQQDSPPLAWEPIQQILINELGPEKLAELEIEKESLASASMGQVHRAKIKKTGQQIVLKVQYPNVDKAIDSDLKAIRTFLNVIKVMPQEINFDPVFDEMRKMLTLETDYKNEAAMTTQFRKLLEHDSRFLVAEVIEEYSTQKIIASTFIQGLRVDDPLIQNLSAERRNRLAYNFLDLYFKELFEWNFIQTDPHLGNYQVQLDAQGNDRLILFDFGAAKRYPPDFMDNYAMMIRSSLLNDIQSLKHYSLKLKFLDQNDSLELKNHFEQFCVETIEPFLHPSDPRSVGKLDANGLYDWKNTDLPQRLSKMVFEILKNNTAWRTPPQEILFIDRKTGGVFIFLSVLKAKISSNELIRKYLDRVHDRVVKESGRESENT
jgi:predicted unusual protein kinase regulating ubiquinone biosynthesis (AarF/ABC1/UbiB family)